MKEWITDMFFLQGLFSAQLFSDEGSRICLWQSQFCLLTQHPTTSPVKLQRCASRISFWKVSFKDIQVKCSNFHGSLFLLNELLAVFRNHFSGAQLRTFQHPSRPKDLFSSEPRPVLHRSVCPQHVATLMPHQIRLALSLYPLVRIVSCLQLGTMEFSELILVKL